MPKFRDRECVQCGEITFNTATRSEICTQCTISNKKCDKIKKEQSHLISLGYKIVSEEIISYANGHRLYKIITPCCNRETTMGYNNILK